MNPVPPLTTILMEFILSGGAEQTISLAHARPLLRTVWILLLKSSREQKGEEGLVPKAGLCQRGLLNSLIDEAIPSLILELRFKTLRRPLSLFVGFPTSLLASLTPETSLGTKWWA
jgi:hypothetical protein